MQGAGGGCERNSARDSKEGESSCEGDAPDGNVAGTLGVVGGNFGLESERKAGDAGDESERKAGDAGDESERSLVRFS